MKKIVPSTPCTLELIAQRQSGSVSTPKKDTKFGYVRDEINIAIAAYDSQYNPVVSITVHIKFGE